MKEKIIDILKKETKLKTEDIENLLEIPPKQEMGDYAFPCFSLAKTLKKSPLVIAEDLKNKLIEEETKEIQSIETKGPYVNFFINKTLLAEKVLHETQKKEWGKQKSNKIKRYIEFSEPNTHKAFHVGHIRGTCLGESLARIFEASGNKVIRGNYSGDTGMHIAKWIWCFSNFHNKEKLNNDESWIASIYVDAVKRLTKDEKLQEEVNLINQKIENKEDKEINDIWKKSRQLSIDSWEKIYKELNTHFDIHIFESEVEKPGKEIALELIKRKIAKKDDGATIIDLKEYNLSVWVLLRSDNTVLYSAKDIALAQKKFKEYPCDNYLITIGDEQTLHFKQLQKVLELIKEKNHDKYNFLPFGMIRFPTGKMSSRTGDNVLYSDFIKKVTKIAKTRIKERSTKLTKKELDKRALTVAIAAIKYSMLKQDPKRTIIFDPKSDIAFEGDTGPYLLYSYARANSIIRNAFSPKSRLGSDSDSRGTSEARQKGNKQIKIIDLKDSEIALIKKIESFPEIIEKAYNQLAPNLIANYSFELAKQFNDFYHNCPVIGGIEEAFRLKLVESFKVTLKKSLDLLGINTLEEM